jgi:hypothetical protein
MIILQALVGKWTPPYQKLFVVSYHGQHCGVMVNSHQPSVGESNDNHWYGNFKLELIK